MKVPQFPMVLVGNHPSVSLGLLRTRSVLAGRVPFSPWSASSPHCFLSKLAPTTPLFAALAPHPTRRNARNPNRFINLLHNSRMPGGGGMSPGKMLSQLPIRRSGRTRSRCSVITPLRRGLIASLLQIFTQLHSFEYGTRLMRYPDFTPVTT
jgi:hypothetical protein